MEQQHNEHLAREMVGEMALYEAPRSDRVARVARAHDVEESDGGEGVEDRKRRVDACI